MKIVVLARQPQLYANQRLLDAATARGWILQFIDPQMCTYHKNEQGNECIHLQNNFKPDAVLARFGPYWQAQGLRALQAFEKQGIRCVNTPHALTLTRNRVASLNLMFENNVPVPLYFSVTSSAAAMRTISESMQFPLVIKQNTSSQGMGVELCLDADTCERRLNELITGGEIVHIQEFIAEANARDYRLFVIGGNVLACMRRTAKKGEFRANIHLGAQAEWVTATPTQIALAECVVALHGLEMAGVDMLDSAQGPLILEVNACPGFEAIEQVSGLNVANKILDLLIT